MAELVPEVSPEATESTEVTLSPVEKQASEQGWVPKEQWSGDPDQWRPAKEFVDRGELFRRIDDQNRTVKELKRTLDEFKSHHAKVREVEYARALTELKSQKRTALTEGDVDQVMKLEDEIDLVKQEQQELKREPAAQQQNEGPHPEFVSWVSENKWYEKDEPMRAYADAIGRNMANRGMSPSEVLKEVAKQVKQEFKHKFTNSNRDKPSAVEGSTNKGSSSKGEVDMTDEERQVMKRFVRQGAMTEKEYRAELAKVKGV